jgi:hypothetical protein
MKILLLKMQDNHNSIKNYFEKYNIYNMTNESLSQ